MILRIRLTGLLLVLPLTVSIITAVHADDYWDGLREGDIIFQETRGPLAEFLKHSTGSRLTHVGIVRETGGGPYVFEATPEGDIFEIPIEEFLERGVGGDYAVYRYDGLEAPPGINHPVILEAFEYYLSPYDRFYRPEKSAFYDSELVRTAFEEVGLALGSFERLRDLDVASPEGRAVFFSDWQNHPDCKAARLNAEACWKVIQGQRFITPASIANDSKLQLVFSSF